MSKTPLHQTVTVRVPATSANLGPGFDCLGMALGMWNRIRLRWGGPTAITVHGDGAGHLRTDSSNLMYRAAQLIFAELGHEGAEVRIETWQDIPLSRGLGSSSAAIVGAMVAANALFDFPVSPPRLLQLATDLEGHPDNVAPALLGGCVVAVRDHEKVLAAPIPLPTDLQCVVFIPEMPLATKKARSVLAPQLSRADAVFNIGRAALLVAAFATDHPEYLGIATQDMLHQPARQTVYPEMKHLFAAARKAGARGVFLSGAGSSVIALTTKGEHRAMTIGYEMADAADKLRFPGAFRVLEPSAVGAQVLALGVED
ncbi:MAG: homoserine kinase [SAR202 cluster bacterium]|nr:homoserine kinase [SAR202 cluster bacterium]